MNYFLYHKWIFLFGGISLLASLTFSMLNRFDVLSYDTLQCAEIFGSRAPTSLQTFNLEKSERWSDYPIEGDLFTFKVLPAPPSFSSDKELNIIFDDLIKQRDLCTIQLDGWANIKGKMVFVFSSTELSTSCLGSVGDSFEDPSFTILSFDFKNFENHSNGYSIPLVTIFDKEFNQKVTLTPISYMEFLNEIN